MGHTSALSATDESKYVDGKTGDPKTARSQIPFLLIPWLFLDRRFDLLPDRVEIEGSRVLHRRIVDRGKRQFLHLLLYAHEAPEFPSVEVIHVTAAEVIKALLANRWRALEWVLADVDHGGHVGRNFGARPSLRLLKKLEFEVVDTNGTQVRTTEVEE